MLKVCLHSEVMSAGGPIHHIKNIAKYIDKSKVELYLATTEYGLYGQHVFRYFKPENIFIYPRENNIHQWNAERNMYPIAPERHPLYDFLNSKNIDILHDSQGGEPIFPTNIPLKIRKFQTNIFAGIDLSSGIEKVLSISRGVYNDWSKYVKNVNPALHARGSVVFLSTDYPASNDNLRKEFSIPNDAIVFGRSSNGYAGDEVNLLAYQKIQSDKTYFLAPAISEKQKQMIKDLELKNVIQMPVICDYEQMSKLYNTMDVLAHNRGESFGCAVSEAIMHGRPVISTGWSNRSYTSTNAQEELIADEKYCAIGRNNGEYVDHYAAIMQTLISGGRDYCAQEGKIFKERFLANGYAADRVVAGLQGLYLS